jgi:serine/threonine-protein kinase
MLAGFGPGSLVGGYRLEAQIGAGGMAVVFRARDEALGRTVALKVLAPSLADDEEFRERFIRESRAAAMVDHPNILPLYRAGESNGVLYIAMRFVPGGDLSSVADREGPLPGERAAFLLTPIAAALDAAHAAGLVHRDVKPANILIDASPGRTDHPYLSDFGLAKSTSGSVDLTGAGQFFGTLGYAAPEQISAERVGPRADQYALGCVAFTVLTGSPPFAGDDAMALAWAQLYDPPPAVTDRRPDIPAAVDRVLARALAKDPDDRFESCGAFARALRSAFGPSANGVPPDDRALGTHPVAAAAGGTTLVPVTGQPPARRRRRLPAVGAVFALAVAAAVLAFFLVPSHARGQSHTRGQRTGATTEHKPATADKPQPMATGRLIARFKTSVGAPPRSLAFRTDTMLVVQEWYASLDEWDVATKTRLHLPSAAAATVLSNDGGLGAYGEMTATPHWEIWDTAAASVIADVPIDASAPTVLALSSQGTLATEDSASDGTDLWNARTGAHIATLTDPDYVGLTDIEISPDGKTLAVLDKSGRIYLWDTETSHVAATLTGPAGNIPLNGEEDMTFSADGTTLAVQTSATSVSLWSVPRHRRSATLTVPFLAISSNGKLVAGSSGKNGITVMNVSTGKAVSSIKDPAGQGTTSAAFSPDGRTLAVGDDNGTVYVWGIAG